MPDSVLFWDGVTDTAFALDDVAKVEVQEAAEAPPAARWIEVFFKQGGSISLPYRPLKDLLRKIADPAGLDLYIFSPSPKSNFP